MNPFGMGIYVISVLHTWFTRSIVTFRSRYGYTLCPAPPTDSRGFGYTASRPIKRVQRLMRLMGLEAVYPKPRLSAGGAGHKVYPYLLRNVAIERVNQVWSTDITYIPMPNGFMYLTAVIDWYSRYVLSWRLSNTLDVAFCLEALEEALSRGCPEVFNTDQGVQFTSASFTGRVESAGSKVSMDGRGRCLDNVFVERLWRTVKYEYVYLWRPEVVPALATGLTTYFGYYNEQRTHQSLDRKSPACVYRGGSG